MSMLPSRIVRRGLAVGFVVLTLGAGHSHRLLHAEDGARAKFHRGDPNVDGDIDITDGVYLLCHLFLNCATPACMEATDVNNDASVNISDAIQILNFLFLGGPAPADPGPVVLPCGVDPDRPGSPGDFGCESYPPCDDAGPADEEFEDLVASYGILRTVAGTGRIGGKGVNGWNVSFEGGPATEAELSRPHFAMSDNVGNIYIADKDAQAVRKIAPDGSIFTVAGTGEAGDDGDEPGPGSERRLSRPNGIWVRGDGTVYILDLGNGKIRRLSPEGELTTLFAVPGGIVVGRGLWVNDTETLAYVSSGFEVKRWTPDGGTTTYADGFSALGNLVVDPAGHLVVTDRGAHRVYRIAEDGEREAIAGNGTRSGGGDGELALETGLNEVRGVWFLDTGGYILGTHEGSQVWYVDTHGYVRLLVDGREGAHGGDGEHFRSPGSKVSEVRAVCVDTRGNILVTEHDAGYIRIIERVSGSQ